MKIEIRNNCLLIDEQEKKISDLTTDLLESILEKSINNEVEYLLEDQNHPVYNFFLNLQNDTKADSDFMKELKKLEDEKKIAEGN